MRVGRTAALIACAIAIAGCEYVVVPPEASGQAAVSGEGWTAVPTSVGPTDGGALGIDLTIRNDTGAWSAMEAAAKPATLTGADGATSTCATVKVGTGGHRVAPGLQIRGYQTGPKKAPVTELIRVECDGATAAAGAKVALEYVYVTGEYNYYDSDATRTAATLEVPLEPLAADLSYPIGETVDGLVQPADIEMTAINGMVLTLVATRRTDTGLAFDWQATNPGEYPSSVHIGTPPVVGADGIVYGFYESPDLASVPVTDAGATSEWTTEVAVPDDVTGLYMLLSVENKKQRLFTNYLLDLGTP
ncbi:MAG TPA: hypothetical protein VI277_05675 [Candidatus Limnocylindria bacterium]